MVKEASNLNNEIVNEHHVCESVILAKNEKQEYKFENMQVRTLKSINNFNLILTNLMAFLSLLV